MFQESNWLAYAFLWQNSPVWYWFAAGFVLLALEILLDGSFFVFFPVGLGAMAAGVANLIEPDLPYEIDAIIMATTAIVLAVVLRWLVPRRGGGAVLNRMTPQVVGEVTVLDEPILNGRGRLSVRGILWAVRGPDLQAGERVRVIDRDGNTLVVEAAPVPAGVAPRPGG